MFKNYNHEALTSKAPKIFRGEATVQRIIKDSGALQKGHFVLSSGLHSEYYIEKFRFLQPKYLTKLIEIIKDNMYGEFDAVCGPETGGIVLAYELARQAKKDFYIAEKSEEGMVVREADKIKSGTRFLVIDDVMTTGDSLRATATAVVKAGGKLTKVRVIVKRTNRSNAAPFDLGFFVFAEGGKIFTPGFQWLTVMDLPVYKEEDCPICSL